MRLRLLSKRRSSRETESFRERHHPKEAGSVEAASEEARETAGAGIEEAVSNHAVDSSTAAASEEGIRERKLRLRFNLNNLSSR
jgi:hypothetical protein